MKMLTKYIFIFLTCTSIFTSWEANAERINKLHLLMISNGHYVDSSIEEKEPDDSSKDKLVDFSGAHVSSAVVNSLFDKYIGLESSTLLRSDENRIITREDIFYALKKVKEEIGSPEPGEYLIVYYVGHGFGEGIAWNYFLQPGNVELPEELNRFDVEALAKQLVYVGYFVDDIKEIGIPYTFLVDACYDGNEIDFRVPILSQVAEKNLQDVVGILKFVNQFRDENPVVFSTTPGNTVKTIKHPTLSKLKYNIGPLSRRLSLIFDKFKPGQSTSVEYIVSSLKDESLDAATQPAVSFVDFDQIYSLNIKSSIAGFAQESNTYYGSTNSSDLKLLNEQIDISYDESDSSEVPENYKVHFSTVTIVGKSGEYISDGSDHIFTAGIEKIEVSTISENEIVLEISANGDDWSFSLAAPKGEKFKKKVYMNVARYPFQEDNQAGLDVSGAGRGCNDIQGEFEIDSIKYTGSIPSYISLSYMQKCDDEEATINGIVILELDI
ncbi:MAG: hypothetical protein GY797_05220 [Deltaproteobacteria bacterium]|nr:hypothetical protein [Deltaproteobacteria bacterium]